MRAGRLKTKRYKVGGRRIGWIFLLILGIGLGAGASALRRGEISLAGLPVIIPPPPTAAPEESIRAEGTFTLPGRTWYSLQVGAYASASEAQTAAEGFRARGAAGYVLAQDGYRVLAAAYETRADAQAVQTQLREQHGVETVIREIVQPEVSLRLTGRQAQLTAISDAWDELDKLAAHLSALSQRLDRREEDAADVPAALESEKETLNALNDRLLALFGETAHPAVRAVRAMLTDLAAALPGADAANTVRLGAGIKYAQVLCVCRMAVYASALTEE